MCNGTNAILADGSTYSGVVTDGDKGTAAYKKLNAAGRKKFGWDKCNRLLGYFASATPAAGQRSAICASLA